MHVSQINDRTLRKFGNHSGLAELATAVHGLELLTCHKPKERSASLCYKLKSEYLFIYS